MKKLFSLLLISSVLFGAGCGKKKCKAAQEQKDTAAQHFVQEERAAKEDYTIVA